MISGRIEDNWFAKICIILEVKFETIPNDHQQYGL